MKTQLFIEKYLFEIQSLVEQYSQSDVFLKLKKQHQNFKVRFPLVGAFSAGKSTLINAFYGEKLLAVQVNPETCLATELHYGAQERIRLMNDEGEVCQLTREQLKNQDFAIQNTDIPHWVDIALPHPVLAMCPELVLVDMPGWESGIAQHSQAIDGYIHRSGAYGLVVSAEEGDLRESLKQVLAELQIYNMPVVLIITKCDKRLPEDIPNIKAKITQSVTDVLQRAPIQVLTVAARKKQIEGFDQVLNLVNGQADLIYQTQVGNGFKFELDAVRKNIQVLLNQDNLSLEEIRHQCEQVPEELREFKEQLKTLEHQIDELVPNCASIIENNMKSSLNSQLNTLSHAVLNKNDVSDVVGMALRQAFIMGIEQDFKPKVKQRFRAFSNISELAPDQLNISSDFEQKEQSNYSDLLTGDGVVAILAKVVSRLPVLSIVVPILHEVLSLFFSDLEKDHQREQQREEAKNHVMNEFIPQIIMQSKHDIQISLMKLANQIKEELAQESEVKAAEKTRVLEALQQDLQKTEAEHNAVLAQYRADLDKTSTLLSQMEQ